MGVLIVKKLLWIVAVLVVGAVVGWWALPHAKHHLGTHLYHVMVNVVQDRDSNVEIEMIRQATRESAAFAIQHMSKTPMFPDPRALFDRCLESIPKELQEGHYCEFGVFTGGTINYIASRTAHTVHGFDSFEGLPEDWRSGFPKGTFDMNGLPVVRSNVQLHKGWFDKSLPVWAEAHPGPMAFMHLDADLYSATKTVFDLLGDRIVPGTVLQFDEYYNYPGWQEGEFKAFQELVQARQIEFEYLGFCPKSQQVALRITKVGASVAP